MLPLSSLTSGFAENRFAQIITWNNSGHSRESERAKSHDFQNHEFMFSQHHVERISSGLRRSSCIGVPISIDAFYLFSPFSNGFLQIQSSIASQDARRIPCINCPPAKDRLATGIPGSDSGMERERSGPWSERLDRSGSDRFSPRSRIARFVVTISYCRRRMGEVSLKTSLSLFAIRATRFLSPRFAHTFRFALSSTKFTEHDFTMYDGSGT